MGQNYLLGNGTAFLAERDSSGNPKNIVSVGNAPLLSIGFSTEKIEHFESESGQNLLDLSIVTQKRGELNMDLEEIFASNLAFLTNGQQNTATSSAQTDTYNFTAGQLVAGMKFKCQKLSGVNVTALSITSTPSVTFVLNTDYSLDAATGIVTILVSKPTVTQMVVAYTPGVVSTVAFFTDTTKEYYMYFSGINKAQSGKRVVCELYRVNFEPTQDLGLIGTELSKFSLKGAVLADATRALSGPLGPFGRFIYVDA